MKHRKLLSLLLAVCMVLALLPAVAAAETSEITDTLDRAFTGRTGTGYGNWTGTGTSGAVYAGHSAGGNNSIQLRSKNSNSGIVTTASGGKATKIDVTWNENTTDGQTLDIYGKNSAYTAPTELYNSSTQGTKLGSIVKGTSTELTITGDYEYIGMRSKSDAMYLKTITITWKKDGDTPPATTYTVSFDANGGSGTMANVTTASPYTLPACGFTAPEGKEFDYWAVDGDEGMYAPGDPYTLTGDTTFIAQWKDAPVAETKKYVKVTEAPEDWSGEYLIVYEEGALVFDSSRESLDAGQNGVSVTIVDSTITTESKYAFTIAAVEGGYSIKSSSGKYIGQSDWNNGMLVNSTYSNNYLNTIGLDVDGNAVISGQGVSNDTHVTLRYNSNTGATNERFRYYKSGQQSIALYKLVEDEPAELTDGFYLIGPEWTINDIKAENMFGENLNAGGEMLLATHLTVGDKIKVVKVENNTITEWYPAGHGNEYTVDAAHAGDVTISFRQTNNDAWSEFGGYFYIQADYAITCVSGDHGLISTMAGRASAGTTVTIYVDPEEGYELDTLTVMCGETAVAMTKVNEWQYTFVMPAGDVTITATFAIPATEPFFKDQNLILDGLIGVSFNMELPEISGVDYSTSYMTFSVPHGTCTEHVDYSESRLKKSSQTKGFVCYVTAVMMAEPITATFHYTQNGTEKTVEKTYSVKDYFKAYDKNKAQFNAKTQTLIESVADYGHYAQAYLATQKGWTFGTDYIEMDKFYTKSYNIGDIASAVENKGITCTPDGTPDFRSVSFALVCDSATEIRILFSVSKSYAGTFTATVDSDPFDVTMLGQRKAIQIANVPAHELSKTYTIVVTTDNGGATIQASALSYVKILLAAYAGNSFAENAAAAIYGYSAAADAYKAAH